MQMPDICENPLRIGIVTRSSRHRKTLTKILDENGLIVVDEELLQDNLPSRINLEIADVLLVNLDDADEPSIDVLIDETDLPILFNDAASIRKSSTVSGKAWGRRLAGKLVELARLSPGISEPSSEYSSEAKQQLPDLAEEPLVDLTPELRLVESEPGISISIDESLLEEAVNGSPSELEHINEITEIPVEINAQSGGVSLDFDNLGLELEFYDTNESESLSQVEVIETQSTEEITNDGRMDIDLGVIDEPEHNDDQPHAFTEDLDEALSDLSPENIENYSNETFESDTLEFDASGALESEKPNETLEIVMHEEPAPAVEQKPVKAYTGKLERQAEHVWVLGASIGGPEAVKRFLAALPEKMPVAFVLAQHIGAGFVTLLAEQLGRVSRLEMLGSEEGILLQDNQLLVAPIEKRLAFGDDGRVTLKAVNKQSIYSPSIDDVMIEVAKRYSGKANAIVFSGMGNDGTLGCQAIAENGGLIWAQTAETCVISSMSDSARNTGIVTCSASPEDLASHLIEHLGLS